MNEIKEYTGKVFKNIKHIDEDGNEFWLARELMPLLEYSKWENFTNAKGEVKVNPQKVPEKELMSINFSGVTFCGDTEDEIPSFKDCTIYDCKFNGLKNKIIIDIDELNTSIFPKLAICDIIDVTVIGNAKSNYEPRHCVKEDGSVIFDDVNDDLFGCYYYDEKGDYVHVHLYQSMKWDTNNKKWLYLDRKEEPNLQIDVTFKEKPQPKKVR